MGSIKVRGKRLYIKFKGPNGWERTRTDFEVGQEKQAQALLDTVEAALAAGEDVEGKLGPLTVAGFLKRWVVDRKSVTAGWKRDEAMFRQHLLEHLGDLLLIEVRPKHLIAAFRDVRKHVAPKTVWNIYSVACAVFRDARLADLLESTPCILDEKQLGPKVDKDPEWRATARYSRDELEQLISDPRLTFDQRVWHALEGIGALRCGEASGLRWRHLILSTEPLAQMVVAKSYGNERNKIRFTRYMPVHPTLAAILAEWRLTGWPEMMGRQPTPDDLVCPMPRTSRGPAGRMRWPQRQLKQIRKDLLTLGLSPYRHGRGPGQHDLRNTFLSLARSDGADKYITGRGTHKPPKEVIEGYTTFEWDVLCREVLKFKIQRRQRGRLVELPRVVNGDRGPMVQATAAETSGSLSDEPDPALQQPETMASDVTNTCEQSRFVDMTTSSSPLPLAPNPREVQGLPGAWTTVGPQQCPLCGALQVNLSGCGDLRWSGDCSCGAHLELRAVRP